MEGLAYCAIVEAHFSRIINDLAKAGFQTIADRKPELVLMAPVDYWRFYIEHKKTGNWIPELKELAERIRNHPDISIPVSFISLDNCVSWWADKANEPPDLSAISLSHALQSSTSSEVQGPSRRSR